MIAAPHLAFLLILWLAGFIAWMLGDKADTPAFFGGVIVAGLGAGLFLGALV